MRVEEKIVVQAGRDGGLQNLEVFGLVKLKVSDEKYGKIKIGILNNDNKGVQIQVNLITFLTPFDFIFYS